MAGEPTNKYRESAYPTAGGSSTLPASGAYGNGEWIDCSTLRNAAYEITYTRGAAGGKFKASADLALDKDKAQILRIQQLQIVGSVFPAEALNKSVPRADEYQPSSGSAELFLFELASVNALFIRLKLAETGDTDNPGTATAILRLANK